jgi:addiction module HigA family antidote
MKFSRRVFKPLRLTALTHSRMIGAPPNPITAILKGERGMTGDTAIRLGTFFKTSAKFWMNLQMTYDLRNAETRCRRELERPLRKTEPPGRVPFEK